MCVCAYICLSGCLIGDMVTICLLVLSVFRATCLLTAGNTNSIDSSEAAVVVNVCVFVCVCLFAVMRTHASHSEMIHIVDWVPCCPQDNDVCVCVYERESVCVCVCVCERERVCVCVCV